MRIAMVGSGYVGLVSGACLADFGHEVACVDKDELKIERLVAGHIPIFEPGLEELVTSNVGAGRLSFTTNIQRAVSDAATVFIAVGTPSRRGDGHADLSYIYQASEEIVQSITGYTVVVTKSTVPVCTGDEVERLMRAARPDGEFSIVSNPEFLREGAAIADFKRPDRIVIGTEEERARSVMAEVYRPLYLNQAPIVYTSRRTAELIKYAANAFLATKVSFINEIADLCEAAGANVQDVARGIGLDRRIGPKFLHAGPGYGGSCFPKDIRALVKTAQDFGMTARIADTVSRINDERMRRMARKIITACDGDVRGKTIAALGLTFKPNTDDVRESPAVAIIKVLQDAGAAIRAYDPAGIEQTSKILSNIAYFENAYACVDSAEALVIMTEWDQFRALDLDRIKTLLVTPIIVDLRNIYRAEDMRARGFQYVSVGR